MEIFEYGQTEIEWLKKRDKRLGAVIDSIGPIEREVIPDMFSALVNAVLGQQISTKAHATVWANFRRTFIPMTAQTIAAAGVDELRGCGVSARKAEYIQGIAAAVLDGSLDLEGLSALDDGEVKQRLSALHGIGVWTAEMLLIFSMRRPDVVSFGDLGILRGMCLLYHHKEVTQQMFERYQKRYSPYGTTASLYLWALSSMSR